MSKKILVDVYSDYVCPFSYMGKVNLDNAIKELEMEDEVEVNFKAYELDEQAPTDSEMPKYDAMVQSSEKPIGVVMAETREVIEQAKDIGVELNYDIMVTSNTKNAHRLTKYAATKGKQKEFAGKVMEAYFVRGVSLNNKEELIKLAVEVGLDKKEANNVLETDEFSDEVAKDKYDAFQYQVQSIPFFMFENRYGASGRQTKEVFIDALKQIKEFNEENDKR